MWLGMAMLAARGRPPPHLPLHTNPQVHISICLAAAYSIVSWLFHSTSHAQARRKVDERYTTKSQCEWPLDVSLSKLCICKATVFNLSLVELNLLPPLHLPPASPPLPHSLSAPCFTDLIMTQG